MILMDRQLMIDIQAFYNIIPKKQGTIEYVHLWLISRCDSQSSGKKPSSLKSKLSGSEAVTYQYYWTIIVQHRESIEIRNKN